MMTATQWMCACVCECHSSIRERLRYDEYLYGGFSMNAVQRYSNDLCCCWHRRAHFGFSNNNFEAVKIYLDLNEIELAVKIGLNLIETINK